MESKQSLCVEALLRGHVGAYVDFFYLTHEPSAADASTAADAAAAQQRPPPPAADEDEAIPPHAIADVMHQLEEAEASRRKGDLPRVTAAYMELANFFTSLDDQRTAIYFWRKCLEVTRLSADVEGEMEVTRLLGAALESAGDVLVAVQLYEKLLGMAQDADSEASARRARGLLVVAYEAVAAVREAEGDTESMLEYRLRRLDVARACGDRAKLLAALLDLGKSYEKLGGFENLKLACGALEQYLELADELDDIDAQGAGAFVLGRIYQRMERTDDSVVQLQRYLELSTLSGKTSAQAEAACSLGLLYYTLADYKNSIHFLEQYFELSKSIGDRDKLEEARIYLGIARGDEMLPAFRRMVRDDLGALLAWKSNRTPFTGAA